MKIDFYTIGVYGYSSMEFFDKLLTNRIDTFLDIRHRRAVRGSQYSFANSNRLQSKLQEMDVNYIHISELSPTKEIISIQNKFDKSNKTSIRHRDNLDNKFISEYKKNILDRYSFDDLFEELKKLNCRKAVFFCVESNPGACHRSLVAEKLEREHLFMVTHL